MTVLGLIRHGVTDWNQASRMQGQTDIPLNKEGERQAQLLAQRLKNEALQWDVLYSSDLSRASLTAEYIREALGLQQIHIHPLLRERKFGLAEGLTPEERQAKFPSGLEPDAQIEPEEEVLKRASRVLDEIMHQHEGKHILIVSHGGFLRKMFKLLSSHLPNTYIANTALTILTKEQDTWNVQLHNCSKHLDSC